MNTLHNLKPVFTFLLIMHSVLFSQKADLKIIDLVTAIKKAENNNFAIKSKQFEIQASKKNYENQKSKTLPNLSLLLFREDRFLSPYNFYQQGASLRSNWALGDFIMNSADVAKSENNIIQSKLEQEKLAAERRVAGIYLHILLKENEIDIQKNRLELMEQHKTISEIGWKAGTRSRLDVLQSNNEITKIKEEIEIIENEKSKYMTEFYSLIRNSDSEPNYKLKRINTETLIKQLLPDTSILSVNNSPFIREYDYRTNTELLKKNIITAQQLPTLGMGGGYLNDSDPTGDGGYWQFNVGISLPLFMWGSTTHQKEISDAKVLSLNSQKNDIKRELKIFYSKTFNELKSYKAISKIQREREAIAEQAFTIAKVDYKAGLITNLEFIDAQQSLAEIKIKIKETHLKYVAKLIDLYLAANQSEILFNKLN